MYTVGNLNTFSNIANQPVFKYVSNYTVKLFVSHQLSVLS